MPSVKLNGFIQNASRKKIRIRKKNGSAKSAETKETKGGRRGTDRLFIPRYLFSSDHIK